MNNKLPSLSLIFPTYNEQDNIAGLILSAAKVAKRNAEIFEIIIVDDGSQDKTVETAEAFKEGGLDLRVIRHQKNLGYGATVWDGLKSAKYEYAFFADADRQFNLEELDKLTALAPQYDAVVGYRQKRQDSFMRIVNAKGWNLANRMLFKLKAKDIDCAFKLFKTSLIKNLEISSRGAMFGAELLIKIGRQGAKIAEVPVTHYPRTAGKQTGADIKVIAKAFQEMFSLYFAGLTAKPKPKNQENWEAYWPALGIVASLSLLVIIFAFYLKNFMQPPVHSPLYNHVYLQNQLTQLPRKDNQNGQQIIQPGGSNISFW